MHILAVYGATHKEGLSKAIVNQLGQSATAAGAEVTYLNLLENELPTFRVDQSFSEHENVKAVRQLTSDAQGYILVTPEYHGCMSNWMKNYLDFHWKEFGGKLFALAASTGGSLGTSCLQQMRIAVQHCHGWTLPYHTSVSEKEFDGQAQAFLNPRSGERLGRMGKDLVTYGQLLQGQFEKERREDATDVGFAAWYAMKEGQK